MGVIGDPVGHTRSPAIFNAAFRAAGLNWAYVAFPVRAGDGSHAVHAARTLGLVGLNVTMPHKADAAWACDELTSDATALGAVNVVTLDGRRDVSWVRRPTAPAWCDRCSTTASNLADPRALVLGAGGAARAIALALSGAGAEVDGCGTPPRRGRVRRRPGPPARVTTPWLLRPTSPTSIRASTRSWSTPPRSGCTGNPVPVSAERLHAGQLVVDTVYQPVETPLLAAARARGATTANGLGMLVHQAALGLRALDGNRGAARRDARRRGRAIRMTAALVVGCSLLGLVVGWFLDPVITRVPLRQPVLGPAAADEPPPPAGRRVAVTVICGALFGGMAARFDDSWALPAYLVLSAALVALAFIDLEHYILPNRIVYPLAGVMIVLLAFASLADDDLDAMGRALMAALVSFGIFFILHLVSPRSMGFGDVKLSFTLGLALGWIGWGEVVVGLFLGFLYGAVIGIILIVTKVRSRNQAVPFGPFLAAGALTAILVGGSIISWYRGY